MMKSRTIFAILLVIGIAGGLVWWMQQPSAAESNNVAAAPKAEATAPATTTPASKVEASKPSPVVVAPTSPNPEAKIAAPTNPRGIVAPPAFTGAAAAASSTVTPVATNPGSSPAANGQGATAGSSKGLHFAAGPEGGAVLVSADLQGRSRLPAFASILGDASQLQLESPIARYTLNIPAILNGGGLDAAKLDGFVYIADSSGKPVIGEEIKSSDPSVAVTAQTRPLIYGDHVAETSAALNQLASNDQVNAGSYEVRLLPALIWLKSEAGGTDLIYTLGTSMNGLKTNTMYTADQYLNALRKANAPKAPRASTGG